MWVVTIARQPIAVELVEDRPAQRGAFGGVGAGPHLVEQDQRALGRLAQDLADPPDVRREGRERLLQALLVADVGQHVVEDREVGALGAGMCSPDWAMTASRPTVLKATVLPPVFGPVTTSIWNRSPRCTSIGTTVRASAGFAGDPASAPGLGSAARSDIRRRGFRLPRLGRSGDRRIIPEERFEQGMPGAPEHEPAFLVEVRGRHPVVEASRAFA